MYGEGNWQADEDYREDLKEFSETHDAEELAREAAEEIGEQPAAGAVPPIAEEDEESSLSDHLSIEDASDSAIGEKESNSPIDLRRGRYSAR